MIRIVLTAVLSIAAGSAFAEQIDPAKIIGGATGDWNHDGEADLALLVAPPAQGDDIGIYIYLRDKDHALLTLAAHAPGKVRGNGSLDGMFGQDPSIEALPSGSIAVHSQNSGIGRDRWEQTLTLAYRNEQFVVAGYTFSHYDTLDTSDNGACDYNVLTGKVTSNGRASKVDAKTISIAEWDDDVGQKACGRAD
ncbi:hypothetical protein ASC97_18900 [Rhizobium sp. Root1203]|uniref:hypothetical protein n=1 Tax=Rhizobium sp. Root1203 TaxID=1736427 RepID=UPI0007108D43|nr:hypothetical protein [Rhizobium sp. Root1203]KQV31753.1 hypothetical protein ASC97_18900 [Rhizobium sp. Root1203]